MKEWWIIVTLSSALKSNFWFKWMKDLANYCKFQSQQSRQHCWLHAYVSTHALRYPTPSCVQFRAGQIATVGSCYQWFKGCGSLLTLTTSSSVERHSTDSVTSVTDPSVPTVTTFTGTATVLPLSTAVFNISVSWRYRERESKEEKESEKNTIIIYLYYINLLYSIVLQDINDCVASVVFWSYQCTFIIITG